MSALDTAISFFRRFGGSSALAERAPGSLVPVARREPAWAPAPPKVDRGTPIGSTGTMVRAGRLAYEEFNPLLDAERAYGSIGMQGVFDLMRRTDPTVRQSLWVCKYPLLSARWAFEPASDDPIDIEIADFCGHVFFERLNWSAFLRQALLQFDFGFMLFEALEETADVPRDRFPKLPALRGPGRPSSGEMVSAALFSSLEPRLPKTIDAWVPRSDRPTMLYAVVQDLGSGDDTSAGGRVTIPADRILRFTHDQEGANFAGVSLLRAAYKPWKIVDVLERIELVRHERQNLGTPVMSLPETGVQEGDADKAEKILRTIGTSERGYVVEPPGWKFRWECSGEGQGTNVGEAIDRAKRDIMVNVIASWMTLGDGDTGSYAMADTQVRAGGFLDSIEGNARQIEDVITRGSDGWSPVRRLVERNYGPRPGYPRLKVSELKSRDYAQMLPNFIQALQVGAVKPGPDVENWFRKRLDLSPVNEDAEQDDVGVEKPKKKAPAEPAEVEDQDQEEQPDA